MVYYLSMQQCEKEGRTIVRGTDREINGYGYAMSFKLGQIRPACNCRFVSKRWPCVRIMGQRMEILTENQNMIVCEYRTVTGLTPHT